MDKKSILLMSILCSNVITLYVMYHYREGFELSRQLTIRRRVDGEGVEYILGFYADAIASCGAAVSVNQRSSMAGHSLWDMACLIAGKREVVWETHETVKQSLLEQIEAFASAMKQEGIREFEGFSFRSTGERSALLLVKAHLINQLENYKNNISFLTGILLGYAEQDIEFSHQRNTFRASVDKDKDVAEPIDIPFSYALFNDDMKERFELFKRNEWITQDGRDNYEKNRDKALQWIKEQDIYSIEQLYEQIAELKKKSNK